MKFYRVVKVSKGGVRTVWRTPFPGQLAAITTTRCYGRLTCSSGQRANPEHREFFYFSDDAERVGYRPCKKCKPNPLLRDNCDHLPFGFGAGFAITLRPVPKTNDRYEVICALCDEAIHPDLGYAIKQKDGWYEWGDGLILPCAPKYEPAIIETA